MKSKMKLNLKEIPISEVVKNYSDKMEEGCIAMDGKLNLRPPYQREFKYDERERKLVINSVFKGYPLNSIYWVKNDDGKYEVLDGQQRLRSICQFYDNCFRYKIKDRYPFYTNLLPDEKKRFLDYKLYVYICTGSNQDEKIEWFRILNMEQKQLNPQEILNAIFQGPWILDAKLFFSKTNCAAYFIGKNYINGTTINQDYLASVLKWITYKEGKDGIKKYMTDHQHDKNADELKKYFEKVIDWIEKTFPYPRSFMKRVNWGWLYGEFGKENLNPNELEEEISKYEDDIDIIKKEGIYPFVLTKDKKYLNLRRFSDSIKRKVYKKQNGICNICNKYVNLSKAQADHIIPWSKGGKTTLENCQILCPHCNSQKGNR